jgi:hypothetical protein
MKRALSAILLLSLAACGPLIGQPPVCVNGWDAKFANRLADEADALPADAATREALAQLAEIRKALPRC